MGQELCRTQRKNEEKNQEGKMEKLKNMSNHRRKSAQQKNHAASSSYTKWTVSLPPAYPSRHFSLRSEIVPIPESVMSPHPSLQASPRLLSRSPVHTQYKLDLMWIQRNVFTQPEALA